MKCHVCGSTLTPVQTSLPFKVSDTSIVIMKELPVLQCDGCKEYLLEDAVMQKVDQVIEKMDHNLELEIVHFAA